jgi:hypothetical protein
MTYKNTPCNNALGNFHEEHGDLVFCGLVAIAAASERI